MDKLESYIPVCFHPRIADLLFDLLYDKYIAKTDTQELIATISAETLEMFLYRTAKYFFNGRQPGNGSAT